MPPRRGTSVTLVADRAHILCMFNHGRLAFTESGSLLVLWTLYSHVSKKRIMRTYLRVHHKFNVEAGFHGSR